MYDYWSIIIKRVISEGLSRLKSDDGTFWSIRKRAHCKLESLIEEISGNWWHRIVRVSWTTKKYIYIHIKKYKLVLSYY